MELNVVSMPANDAVVSKIKVSDDVFGRAFNEPLIHQVVTAYMAGARAGTKSQKTRAEVRGGGRKPWKQKGTGRARVGSSRNPIWRGGGVTFAAKPRDHSQKVNKKMYRGAMMSIFSELIRQNRLVVVDSFIVEEARTKLIKEKLKEHEGNILILTHEIDENLYLSSRNLSNIGICDMNDVDPVSLVRFDTIIVTVDALKNIEERLG